MLPNKKECAAEREEERREPPNTTENLNTHKTKMEKEKWKNTHDKLGSIRPLEINVEI